MKTTNLFVRYWICVLIGCFQCLATPDEHLMIMNPMSSHVNLEPHTDDTYIPTMADTPEWDTSGYIMFCPCMGNFGNQVEYLIGSLAFAKALNRTLVLPPFRIKKNIPFKEWFLVEPLQNFHNVITMEEFLASFGGEKWPPGERVGFCGMQPSSSQPCDMKIGAPLKPFWNDLNVTFDDHVKYTTFNSADITNSEKNEELKELWHKNYPVSEYPVIVFQFPPAQYPMFPGNRQIQQYLQWNPDFFAYAEHEISRLFNGERYIGIHLRTGRDWEVSCRQTIGSKTIMASTQCLAEGQRVFREMCYPPVEHIVNLTTQAVLKYSIHNLFIATDKYSYSKELNAALNPLGVKVHHLDPQIPQLDVMILGQSDFFIGNCASSFTSFVKRERDVHHRPSTFWGFPV